MASIFGVKCPENILTSNETISRCVAVADFVSKLHLHVDLKPDHIMSGSKLMMAHFLAQLFARYPTLKIAKYQYKQRAELNWIRSEWEELYENLQCWDTIELQLTTGEFTKGIGGQVAALGKRMVRLAHMHTAMTTRKNQNVKTWKIVLDKVGRFMWQLLLHKVMGESGELTDAWLEKEKDMFAHLSEERVTGVFAKYQKKYREFDASMDSTRAITPRESSSRGGSSRVGTPNRGLSSRGGIQSRGGTPKDDTSIPEAQHVHMPGDHLQMENPDLGEDEAFFGEEFEACEHVLLEHAEKLAAIYNHYSVDQGRDTYSLDRFQFLAFAEDIKFSENELTSYGLHNSTKILSFGKCTHVKTSQVSMLYTSQTVMIRN